MYSGNPKDTKAIIAFTISGSIVANKLIENFFSPRDSRPNVSTSALKIDTGLEPPSRMSPKIETHA